MNVKFDAEFIYNMSIKYIYASLFGCCSAKA